ncbi:hypothetical protein AB6A40_004331 [Gnathostoma spinigerum]|uniref:C2H2-type domain-containing protein n=1 Tax=Gnathostoma spinigerum TaxID=75299 RepID=A0ABD6EEC4_9BILA
MVMSNKEATTYDNSDEGVKAEVHDVDEKEGGKKSGVSESYLNGGESENVTNGKGSELDTQGDKSPKHTGTDKVENRDESEGKLLHQKSRNSSCSVSNSPQSQSNSEASNNRSRSRSVSSSRKRSRSYSKSQSRSRSVSKSRKKSRKRSRKSRSRSRSNLSRRSSSSSSSRDTYDSFKPHSSPRSYGEFSCKDCDRTDFDSIRELSEHQIRAHGAELFCPHCDTEKSSIQKLVDHLKKRHDDLRLLCEYCKDDFGKVSSAKDSKWENYRSHVYSECLKEKMYNLERKKGRNGGVALRGRGRCPHGPPVKCKNFPKCPGVKCYYSHGYCRYDTKCNKKECPFDHSDRPRVCLSCIRDHKLYSNREERRSRR